MTWEFRVPRIEEKGREKIGFETFQDQGLFVKRNAR